jgi:hypothetical protein
MELGGPHRNERRDHRDEAQGIQGETDRDPDGGDQDAGDGRTDDPRRVVEARVECDRILQLAATDELNHERLTAGIIENEDGPPQRRQHVDDPDGGDVQEDDECERRRQQGHSGLRDDHHAPTIEAVGECSADQTEDRVRPVEAKAEDADRLRRVR